MCIRDRALSWVLLALFGALPYVFTGAMTSYIDALFETVSGLTTTGSSTFTAVSHLPRSVLLWRSLTQWMGGMGVLVLFLALTPRMGEGAVFLMRAESPGPIKSKLVPKVGGTAKILYLIYVVLTLCEVLALRLAVLHNLWFYNELMAKIREALDNGTFQQFHDTYVHKLDTRI